MALSKEELQAWNELVKKLDCSRPMASSTGSITNDDYQIKFVNAMEKGKFNTALLMATKGINLYRSKISNLLQLDQILASTDEHDVKEVEEAEELVDLLDIAIRDVERLKDECEKRLASYKGKINQFLLSKAEAGLYDPHPVEWESFAK